MRIWKFWIILLIVKSNGGTTKHDSVNFRCAVSRFFLLIVALFRYWKFKRIVISYFWIKDLLTSKRGKRKLMHTHKPALNTKKVMWRGRLVEIRSACNVLIDFFFRNSNFQLSFVSSIMYFLSKKQSVEVNRHDSTDFDYLG